MRKSTARAARPEDSPGPAGQVRQPVLGSQSTYRAIGILRCVSGHNQNGITATRLCAEVGLTLATTHRLLQVLVSENMLTVDPYSKRYHLGLDLFVLGREAFRFGVKELVGSRLERIRDTSGETVFLLIRSGTDALCLARLDGDYPIRALTLKQGSRRPLGIGAGGLALLAGQPVTVMKKILMSNSILYEDYADVDVEEVRSWVRTAKRRGFSFNDGRLRHGVRAVGMSIGPEGEPPVAAVSVATCERRMAADRRRELERTLKAELAGIDWSLLERNP